MVKLRNPLSALVLLPLLAAVAFGKFAQPSLMPAERLLARAQAHLTKNPDDANAHYTMGRIHYLAFHNRSSKVAAFGSSAADGLPSTAPYWTAEQSYLAHARRAEATDLVLRSFKADSPSDVPRERVREFWRNVSRESAALAEAGWKPESLKPELVAEHAALALRWFDSAIKLDPDNALYLLGKASLLEQAREYYAKAKPTRKDSALSTVTIGQVRAAYHAAYAAGIADARKLERRPVAGLRSIASFEAGSAFVRLSQAGDLDGKEKSKLAAVQSSLAKLDKLRRGAITPILFAMRDGVALDDLLEPSSRVQFDLDGDGTIEVWPWVRPDTGFLVWDPARTGRILSGRQLFGSYTFQIPWAHGYQPLAMLDSTGDGELSGIELEGIRAWFDRNSNGISEDGEVLDLEALAIEAIAASGKLDTKTSSPANSRGIRLTNNSSLASWDWVPHANHHIALPTDGGFKESFSDHGE